jgi:hypothetical protein
MSSDIGWIVAISSVFLLIGAILPIMANDYGATENQNALCKTPGGLNTNDPSKCYATQPTAWDNAKFVLDILLSMVTMFFWNWQYIPWWLNLVPLLPIRLAFFVLLIRNMPSISVFGFSIGGSGGG